jgi:hypothetical protein
MELVFDAVEETLEVESELLLELVEEVEFDCKVDEEEELWVEVVEEVEFDCKVDEEDELSFDVETVVVVELPEKEKYASRVNELLGVTTRVLFNIPLLQ